MAIEGSRERAVVVGVLVALLVACVVVLLAEEPLFALHDVRLHYAINDAAAGGSAKVPLSRASLKSRVAWRLAVGRVRAQVEVDESRDVYVTVDEGHSATTNAMLLWRGGIALYRPDPSYRVEPTDTSGLREEPVTLASGTTMSVWTGSREAISRAARALHVDEHHRVLLEWYREAGVRLWVASVPAVADLAEGTVAFDVEGGRKLGLLVKPALEDTVKDLRGGEMLLVTLDQTVLAAEPLPKDRDAPIAASFGSDVTAYTTSAEYRRWLGSPVLPPLRQVGGEHLAPDYALAAAVLGLPLVVCVAWLYFIRRFDRAQPEPLWLVVATFCLGGLSTVPCYYLTPRKLTPYLDPHVMTLGGRIEAFPIALLVFTVSVGIVEEGAKLLAVLVFARRRREFDEPVDGIVYSSASALGFAFVEDIAYFNRAQLSAVTVSARSLFSAHIFFSALWGYALGRALVDKKTRVLPYFLLAALLHGLWDTLCSFDGLAPWLRVEFLALAAVLVALLRKALRYGAVTEESRVGEHRHVFELGNRRAFAVWAALVFLLGYCVLTVSSWFESQNRRVDFVFLVGSALLVVLLGACAMRLAASLPLDAVVDDAGVTMAGATRAWATITGLRRRKRMIHIHATGGDLHLGPAEPATIAAIAAAIQGHRRSELPREDRPPPHRGVS